LPVGRFAGYNDSHKYKCHHEGHPPSLKLWLAGEGHEEKNTDKVHAFVGPGTAPALFFYSRMSAAICTEPISNVDSLDSVRLRKPKAGTVPGPTSVMPAQAGIQKCTPKKIWMPDQVRHD